jgi:hypothetical protein
MMLPDKRARDYFAAAIALALAALLIYAGAEKVGDPLQLADNDRCLRDIAGSRC